MTEVYAVGGFEKQYHVNPNPVAMINFGISTGDLLSALERNNANQGAGFVEQNGQQVLIRSEAQLKGIDDIGQVVVKIIDGVPVKIQDIAQINLGKELRSGAGTLNGQETVIGTTMMLVGENSRTVAKAVDSKLETIKTSLPEGVILEAVYDRTSLVDKTIDTVQKNLVEGALLVIVVLFVLLGNVRAALITAAVIPLAMLATISGMVKTDVSANLMSLGALDFGLIVDGAVIIVENCIRRLSESQKQNGATLPLKERLNVVYEATNEVIRPSLFGVLIITIVYIPLFTLTGVEGKMFHPMAATVIMALLAAMVFCFTVVPAAIAIFMRGKISEKESPIIKGAKAVYRPVLTGALRFRWLVVVAASALVVGSLWMGSKLGSEFIPQLNEGDILVQAIRIPGTGVEQAVEMQKTLEAKLMQYEQVQTGHSVMGAGEVATDPMPPNITDTFVILKPREQWPDPSMTKAELVETFEEDLFTLPGNNYEFTQPIQMRFNELLTGVRADLGIKLFGDDLDTLFASAFDILTVISTIEGADDARLEQVEGIPIFTVTPKLDQLARFGLDIADLQLWLNAATGGETAGMIFEGDRRFEIVVRYGDDIRNELTQLESVPIVTPSGEHVPISELATLAFKEVPSQISRENGKRSIVVTANVRDRDIGTFVEEAQARINDEVDLPAGYWLDYGGTFEQLESASQRLTIVVPVTLFVILTMLVIAFGSIRDALIIFTGILGINRRCNVSLVKGYAFIHIRVAGFIALSGIAVLNGLQCCPSSSNVC